MSENGQQTVMVESVCGQCKAKLYLRVPPMRFINAPDVSLAIMSHEKAQVCQQCGSGYVPVFKGIKDGLLDIQFAKVSTDQQPIIVPPTPQQTRAVQTTTVKQASKGLVLPR